MSIRHRIGTTLVLFLAASGFLGANGGETRKLEGRDSGRFFLSATADPDVKRTQDFANGQSPLLGKYNLVAHEGVNLKTGQITDGAFTITAENGDTILGEYGGSGAPTEIPGVITYVATGAITEGTGAFAGASGTLTFSGVADLRTGVLSEMITGDVRLHESRSKR